MRATPALISRFHQAEVDAPTVDGRWGRADHRIAAADYNQRYAPASVFTLPLLKLRHNLVLQRALFQILPVFQQIKPRFFRQVKQNLAVTDIPAFPKEGTKKSQMKTDKQWLSLPRGAFAGN